MGDAIIEVKYRYMADVFDPANPRRKGTRKAVIGATQVAVPSVSACEAPVVLVDAPGPDGVQCRAFDGGLYAPRARIETHLDEAVDANVRDPDGNGARAMAAATSSKVYLVVDGVKHLKVDPVITLHPGSGTICFQGEFDNYPGVAFSALRVDEARAFAAKLEALGYGHFREEPPMPTVFNRDAIPHASLEAPHLAFAALRSIGRRDNGHLMPGPAAALHAELMAYPRHFDQPIGLDDSMRIIGAFGRILEAARDHSNLPHCAAFLERNALLAERLAFEEGIAPVWLAKDDEEAAALSF